MDDIARAEVSRLVAAAGVKASHQLARYWYAEACKIAEQVNDPVVRWEILTTALSRIGWDDEGKAR